MSWLELSGVHSRVLVQEDLTLAVTDEQGRLLWTCGRDTPPAVAPASEHGEEPRTLPLSSAGERSVAPFAEGPHQGHAIRLSAFPDTDLVLELVLALDPEHDELLVQVAQRGGEAAIERIDHLYRFEQPVAAGGYLVLPHGSGYLIPADSPEPLAGDGIIGHRWTLPLVGMVQGRQALYAIVESWWDASVAVEHVPGERSAFGLSWLASLGALRYPRRCLLRFAEGVDYAAMAKAYRAYAQGQGLLRTLVEKADGNPTLRRYLDGVEFRWLQWQPEHAAAVLADIRLLQAMGIPVSFFFPKWPAQGYAPDRPADGTWQGYLHPGPVPGGWETLRRFAEAVRALGCPVKGFVVPHTQHADLPGADRAMAAHDATGQPLALPRAGATAVTRLSARFAGKVLGYVLDRIQSDGPRYDALYFDGYSAHGGHPEDFAPAHPMSRRDDIGQQVACFHETRRRGLIPGAELARFWSVADCDFFFFTDWSSDRLVNVPQRESRGPAGVPVPLFQLVFHDCYAACFSGGGYALYAPGYDWWAECTPRLYELLFCAMPAHNWLPDGHVPVPDWDSERARARWAWLKTWRSYYRAIAYSELTAHEFLNPERTRQRIYFANGVIAEFDFAAGRFRVSGVADLPEGWVTPPAALA